MMGVSMGTIPPWPLPPERRVIYRYALRSALLPVITVGGLLGGLRGLSPREISSGLYSALCMKHG